MGLLFLLLAIIGPSSLRAQSFTDDSDKLLQLSKSDSRSQLVSKLDAYRGKRQLKLQVETESGTKSLVLERGNSIGAKMDLSIYHGYCEETNEKAGCIIVNDDISVFIHTKDGDYEVSFKTKAETNEVIYSREWIEATAPATDMVGNACGNKAQHLDHENSDGQGLSLAHDEAHDETTEALPNSSKHSDIRPDLGLSMNSQKSKIPKPFDDAWWINELTTKPIVGQRYITIYLWEFTEIAAIYRMMYWTEKIWNELLGANEVRFLWKRPLLNYHKGSDYGLTESEFKAFLKANKRVDNGNNQLRLFNASIEKYFSKYVDDEHIVHAYLRSIDGWNPNGGGVARLNGNYFLCRDRNKGRNAHGLFVHELGHIFGATHVNDDTDVMNSAPGTIKDKHIKMRNSTNRNRIIRNTKYRASRTLPSNIQKLIVNKTSVSKLESTTIQKKLWVFPKAFPINSNAVRIFKVQAWEDLTYAISASVPSNSRNQFPKVYVLDKSLKLVTKFAAKKGQFWCSKNVDLRWGETYYLLVTVSGSSKPSNSRINVSVKGKIIPDNSVFLGYQSFEGKGKNVVGWGQQSDADDTDWTFHHKGGTPSAGTGPSAASHGVKYAYLEASTHNASMCDRAVWYSGKWELDERPTRDYYLNFRYHMYTRAPLNMGELHVEISTDRKHWLRVKSIEGNQGNKWHATTISIDDHIKATTRGIYVRFVAIRGNNYQSDIAIDAVYAYTRERKNGSPAPAESNSLGLTRLGDNNQPMILYPNPVSNKLNITLGGSKIESLRSISVLDGKGQKVLECNSAELKTSVVNGIDVHTLSPGTYILELISNDGSTERKRFIKR